MDEPPLPRVGAETGLGKQRRPRQTKLQRKVPYVAAVDAAVRAPPRKSAFGRELRASRKADFAYGT
ncbi:hypothetical protein CHLRE_15g641500v5 [Chlamydomonas reinhardtii]|uniref:Uncharacterized protein n=1 Tax=Chlamydomonas reinhardtii TaxID=3055 RepID=A0A2K3CWU9_CHLRE|nr:uncharacterized protein CHLRE_15g641500v5 [Chlamydomonas reinhardtii]PNW72764.1 hypothetical protein CHLRE_15g641500v5 [Chlamydomonas reinhardtii]